MRTRPRADFYLDVISGAVWRDNDEDFVPNELFTVWQEVGRMWLIEKLTNPDFGEEEEEDLRARGGVGSASGSITGSGSWDDEDGSEGSYGVGARVKRVCGGAGGLGVRD